MDSNADSIYSDIPFRVRVGVIGEKHFAGTAKLTEKFLEIFPTKILELYDVVSQKKIQQTKQNHTSLAFSVLMTLGGDSERLIAEEVLEQKHGALEVILPCSKTSFLHEFLETSAHHKFEELFKRARRPIALRKHIVFSHWTPDERTENMREMLRETRRYIVDRADVLLVVRGEESEDENLSDIIEYAKNKQRPVICISAQTPFEITVENGHGLNADAISGLEAFNSFPVDSAKQDSYIENVYRDLFADSAGIDESAKQTVREYLLPFYVRASKLAKKNQKIYQRAGLLVYSFSAIAVGAVALGTLAHQLSPWAFGLELLLLMAILITVLAADRNRTHRKWIENRFLAERLRAAQFLAACGVEVTPIKVPPYLGTKGQSDDWTLIAFNEIWRKLPALHGCSGAEVEKLKEFIRVSWLEDQIKFHQKKTLASQLLSHRLEWGGIVVFGCALLAAALHLLFFILHNDWMELPLTFAAIVLPAVGAAVGGIRSHREYSRLAKRSENMAQNLSELKDNLKNVTKPDEFEMFLREIEAVMLVETQDWLMLMRFAKLETAA